MLDDNYIQVHYFMINDLGLKKEKLLIYAYLHHLSGLGAKATEGDIMRFFKISYEEARKTLVFLLGRGLVKGEKKTSENAPKKLYWVDLDEITDTISLCARRST